MFKEIEIPLQNGLSLAAKTWGDPKNMPLIAIHGWLDNANSFMPMAEYLQDKFYLVALDLIGHGHSDHLPDAASYYYLEAVLHVITVANQLGLKKFSLLAHSLGAGIAPLVAACIPERISYLFLLEGLGPLADSPDHAVEQLQHYIKSSLRGRENKTYANIENAIETRIKNTAMTYASAKLIVERGMILQDNIYHWRHDPRLLYPPASRLTEAQVAAFLQAVTCPTILVWAEHGNKFRAAIAERQQQIKHLSVHHIPGGHHAHMDYPKETAEIIVRDMF